MIAWTQAGPAMTAAFLASFVEFVEALTIVLAVGVTRGWKSSWLGTILGAFVLLCFIFVFGPVVQTVPIRQLQLAIGVLLLFFGFRWLRKAMLRSAGVIALHDETLIYEKETRALLKGRSHQHGYDAIAVVTTFKAVLLEGLEVVFIVIATGSASRSLWPAALGAMIAGFFVVLLGLIVHRPLSRVPENKLKYVVGLLLSAFGIFWIGESLGYPWPGKDLSIVGLVILLFACSLLGVTRAKHAFAKASQR